MPGVECGYRPKGLDPQYRYPLYGYTGDVDKMGSMANAAVHRLHDSTVPLCHGYTAMASVQNHYPVSISSGATSSRRIFLSPGHFDTVIRWAFALGTRKVRCCLASTPIYARVTLFTGSDTAGCEPEHCAAEFDGLDRFALSSTGACCHGLSEPELCYIPGMFRALLICLALLVCPVHAEDDLEALRNAAEQGVASAQYKLGSIYHSGAGGITRDYT